MTIRRETLLRARRMPDDCIFTLSLTFDPTRAAEGITFTEFYDYGPTGADDAGREYGYSVHAPYGALGTLAEAYAPGADGPAEDRLLNAFKALVVEGVLADGLRAQACTSVVLRGFIEAGVEATTSDWFWVNSD
ncbi:hypothetical protein [Kribbella sp. NPDC055071]